MSLNLSVMLVESAKRLPEHTAIIYDDLRMTFRDLDIASNRLAHGLASLGLRPGQKVLLMLGNIPEFAVCYYGILKAGGVIVPCNVQHKAREIEYLLSDSESVIAITSAEYVKELVDGRQGVSTCRFLVIVDDGSSAPIPETKGLYPYESLMRSATPDFDMVHTQADDTAAIVYTSGTTGKPKGAELTHFSQFFQCRALPSLTEDMSRPDDVTLAVLPLFHAFGQTCVMGTAVAMGTTISLVQRFDAAKVFQVMQRDRVTCFSGVPTMYVQLLNHPDRTKYDLSKLRRCVSGGAPIAVETLAGWKKAYGFDISEGYGLTETAPIATFSLGDIKPKYGRCGKPAWGVEIRIANDHDETLPVGKEGEVLIRGVNIMKGYYKNPEATAAALKGGWLHTGDIGKLDEEGYLSIVGRKKEMIIRGGYNVYPREIEELLYEHPAVQEAAVIGVPHAELGEEVKAVVCLKAGARITADEIRAYCKERIAAYKYPRLVEIRSEPLPKGATGKIQKRDLS
jgi:long-chain acyl-CoA synthetase